jgi:hypothetical protein
LLGTPKGYIEKALEISIFFYGDPSFFGNLQEGSYTRDFERWKKGLWDHPTFPPVFVISSTQ